MSDIKIVRTSRKLRLAGIAFLVIATWNLLWVFMNLNLQSVFEVVLASLFAVATTLVFIHIVIHVVNSWHFRMAQPKLFEGASKPVVAIIIPVYGESTAIVSNTIRSVLLQKWPNSKMLIIVTDDGRSDALEVVIEGMKKSTAANLIYFRPPTKDDPKRRGEAKAGNLNAALDYIIKTYPAITYIETRDADDLVANKDFISHCVEYLESHPKTSFVQTIKQCRVSPGDPFSNQESIFYQRSMPAKFAANAVFPCGSGLIWRRQELQRIGGFPSWNLVEDLQSGYEILCRGGQGAFLPIVGAVGQIAPEDIPNFYKQRGTWALDTLRLFYYRNPFFSKGLSFSQKLHFLESELSYLVSFAVAIFIVEIVIGLNFGISPVASSGYNFFMHLCLLAAVLEAHSTARSRGISYHEQWIARQIWMGLMPVFIVAAVRALLYGPNRKPRYKVTRKYHKVGWYWRETLVQTFIVLTLIASIIRSLLQPHGELGFDLGLQFWAVIFAYGFSRVVMNSWHNYQFPISKLFVRRTRPAH